MASFECAPHSMPSWCCTPVLQLTDAMQTLAKKGALGLLESGQWGS